MKRLKNTMSQIKHTSFSKSTLKKKQTIFFELKDAYHRSTAARLASSLKENEPCPVCGSKSHPKKTLLTSNSVTESQYDLADKVYNELVQLEIQKRIKPMNDLKKKNY